jgi:hypothetical protein
MINLRHRLAMAALSIFGVAAFFYAFQLIGCMASEHVAASPMRQVTR